MAVKASKTRSCSRFTIIFIASNPKKVIDGNPLIVHGLSLQHMAWGIKLDKDATTRIDLLECDNQLHTLEFSTTIRNWCRAKKDLWENGQYFSVNSYKEQQPVAHRARFTACPGRALGRHARAVDERYIRQRDLISLRYSWGIRRAVLKLFRFIPAAELRKLFYSLELVRHLDCDCLLRFLLRLAAASAENKPMGRKRIQSSPLSFFLSDFKKRLAHSRRPLEVLVHPF